MPADKNLYVPIRKTRQSNKTAAGRIATGGSCLQVSCHARSVCSNAVMAAEVSASERKE